MKKILLVLKKIVISYIVLYGYNLIAVNFSLVIPINLITVLLVTILGVPSLIALILLKIVAL